MTIWRGYVIGLNENNGLNAPPPFEEYRTTTMDDIDVDVVKDKRGECDRKRKTEKSRCDDRDLKNGSKWVECQH